MKNLTEGLRAGDLEDIVLPMISMDEYDSKIDKNAIVFAFYASDFEAAEDLNRFIQRSAVEILDTEISPAPDQHGYYMIFMEMLRNDLLVDNLMQIVDEVSPLVGIKHWRIHARGVSKLVDMTSGNIRKILAIQNKLDDKKRKDEAMEKVAEAFRNSLLSSVSIDDDQIVLERMTFKIIDVEAESDALFEKFSASSFNDDLRLAAKNHQLSVMLGENWSVTTRDDGMVVLRYPHSRVTIVLS